MKYAFALFVSLTLIFSCKNDKSNRQEDAADMGTPPVSSRDIAAPEQPEPDTLQPEEFLDDSTRVADEEKPAPKPMRPNYSPSAPSSTAPGLPPGNLRGGIEAREGFVDIQQVDPSIRLDIRYATTNNFTESKIYDCPRCFLRPETAQALAKAQSLLKRQGLGLKLFDCYRPRPYQQRLWDKVPNPDYVAPPDEGSMHSRGAAVDLTLVDAQGRELDMGTSYDFFGKEAHSTYYQLPGQVLKNRQLLKRVMEDVGLKGIRTEWWHFSYQRKSFPFSDWVWECRD